MLTQVTKVFSPRAIAPALAALAAAAPLAIGQVQYVSRTGTFHVIAGATDHSMTLPLSSGNTDRSEYLSQASAACLPAAIGTASMTTTLRPDGFSFVSTGLSSADPAACGNATEGLALTSEDILFTVASPIQVSLSGNLDACSSSTTPVDPVLSVSLVGLGGAGIVNFQLSNQGSFDQDFSECVTLVPGTYHLTCSAQTLSASSAGGWLSATYGLEFHMNAAGGAAPQVSLAHASVCPGGQAALSCAKPGAGAFTYQWRKDGLELSDNLRISGSATNSLAFAGATPADAGSYDCIVTGACGPLASTAATLTFCAADFDCSGDVSVQDIFAYVNAWLANDPRADINGGGTNVSDIFDFLSGWFAGCP
jgi:hypothetical protein